MSQLTLSSRRGQALVLVTLALVAMCGVMGLAVDLGWSYFVKKSAQSAADAAALAAAEQALKNVGPIGPYTCGAGLSCTSGGAPTDCPSAPASPPADNLGNGCLYAMQNGFTNAGNGGRQAVSIAANTTSPPPTVPGVTVLYWTTVRTSETIPQLFSAVLGNTTGIAATRATASIADTVVIGNLWALNRKNDPGPDGTGRDITVQGNGSIIAGGITMASTANDAGFRQGASSVTADWSATRGGVHQAGGGTWTSAPQTGAPDGTMFTDPFSGDGQPAPPTGLTDRPIQGNTITGDCTQGGASLPPGNYYATQQLCAGCAWTPSGRPINFVGCVTTSAGSGQFGGYVFYGGLAFGAGTFTFGPGRYVLAGTQTGTIWSQGTNAIVTDTTPPTINSSGQNAGVVSVDPGANNAGEIFIFTDSTYGGRLQVPSALANVQGSLGFGQLDIQMGGNTSSYINLHGLNATATNPPPSELTLFEPVVWWQDQRNSRVTYNPDGTINTSAACGGGGTLDTPCYNKPTPQYTDMTLQADPQIALWGVVYQPRGASMTLQGLGNHSLRGPVEFVTGSFGTQGGGNLDLTPLDAPLHRRVVALIE